MVLSYVIVNLVCPSGGNLKPTKRVYETEVWKFIRRAAIYALLNLTRLRF